MRIVINDIIPLQEQQRYGKDWKIITGARVIRDAAILIERKAKVEVKPMATNHGQLMCLDLVFLEGKEFDTFIDWLKSVIPPDQDAHGEMLIKAFAIGCK